ncbi:KGGVGR-motif variant AAA ATPase [Herbaspirillum robiniae]|uniref:KGGVGR-motif variant AAA ATPase n=1 Tax=Herbaspirillum robiniae TaxID=2014887 RepID=UPI0009A1E830|nr:AAA family ATPase [Herbaspirillum robiniae]
MSQSLYFDDTLPSFAALVEEEWGTDALATNFFLRDVTGKLTFVVLDSTKSADQRTSLAAKTKEKLAVYVDDAGMSVASPEELFDDRLSNLSIARDVLIKGAGFDGRVKFVDRRMVGADWLRSPVSLSAPPIRFSFASIKGGVGRSTALCVVAAHLASEGRRVLTIDMDLEAPGLGNMLLPDGTLPEFGLLDYLVESNLTDLDDPFFMDMVGPSWLGGGLGRVDVVPAIGKRSLECPENVLAKIARAYLGGNAGSFTEQMEALIRRLAPPHKYDVILLDARAGLHETTAAGVIGLGAEVFLFGIDQPQTIAGYELLFAHLGTLPKESDNDDWRNRLRFVQAKASIDSGMRDEFGKKITAVMQRYLVESIEEAAIDVSSLKDSFEVEWSEEKESTFAEEEDLLVPVIAISNNDRFQSFDPMKDRSLLVQDVYQASFGELIGVATVLVNHSLNAWNEQ